MAHFEVLRCVPPALRPVGCTQAAQRAAAEQAQGRAQQRAEEERRAADAVARCGQLEAELEVWRH